MKMKKVYIVDPALKDNRGHHFSLTKNISEHLLGCGYKVIWFVNKKLAASINSEDLGLEASDIRRIFSEDTYDAHRKKYARLTAKRRKTAKQLLKSQLLRAYAKVPEGIRTVISPALKELLKRIRPPGYQQPRTPVQENGPEKRPGAADELYRGLKAANCTSTDIVFFHTCDATTYRDIVEFFAVNSSVWEWSELPTFHLSTPYDETVMPHNRDRPSFDCSLRRLSYLNLLGTKVFLYAENELLAEHLSSIVQHPVTPLPIPPPHGLTSKSVPSDKERPMVFSYLGAAREEKGFNEVVEAVLMVLTKHDWTDVEFVIQITPPIMGYSDVVKKAVDQLRAYSDRRLRLLASPLSQEEYDQLVQVADVVFLCYEAERYRVRSSGIAIECVVGGTSMITTAGSFPSYVSREPDLEIPEKTADSISSAIHYAYHHRAEICENALHRRNRFLSLNSGEAFVSRIEMSKSTAETENPTKQLHADTTVWKKLVSDKLILSS